MKRLFLIALSLFCLTSYAQTTTTERIVTAKAKSLPFKVITTDDIANVKVGDSVLLTSKVYSGKFLDNTGLTLLNLGADYPNQLLTVVIRGNDRKKFASVPEELFKGKTVSIDGIVSEYKGRKQIVVTNPEQIKFKIIPEK
ncbi:hypothetical protein [Desertivirga arenae]|uniref:hypothetical protein n=1 Tax=Desertivirga arenae TaxID=2810309 RepID=UPI001A9781E9|nr:hypothetical protein [Pedobacter sp. SYSU D00823]